jgi:hypothetical protein
MEVDHTQTVLLHQDHTLMVVELHSEMAVDHSEMAAVHLSEMVVVQDSEMAVDHLLVAVHLHHHSEMEDSAMEETVDSVTEEMVDSEVVPDSDKLMQDHKEQLYKNTCKFVNK